jgi:hypothetical protein
MTVRIEVMPVADRESRIQQAGVVGQSPSITYHDRLTSLPVKRVPLDLPIYRTANIRTITHQLEELAGRNDPDFFKRQEDQSVQQDQHGILFRLSKESKANIYGRLSEKAEQTEALIVTEKGVVLNGNRRLAAMRELRGVDPKRFARFSTIDVAVLPPDATEDDLMAIETKLQISPDMRLGYGWADEAIGLQRQLKSGWNFARAAATWDEKEASLRARLARLQVAEQFLSYLNKTGHYLLVQDDEQAFATFTDKQSARAATASASRAEAERLVFFAILATRPSKRVYEFATQIEAITTAVLVAVEAAVPADAPAGKADAADPLAGMAARPDAVRSGVLNYLRDSTNASDVSAWAVEARDALELQKKANKRSNELVRVSGAINAAAAAVTLRNADPTTVGPAANQMVFAIASLAERLAEAVQVHPEVKLAIDEIRLSSAIQTLSAVRKVVGRP